MRINTRKKRGGNPILGNSAGSYVFNNYGTTDNQMARVNSNYTGPVAPNSSFLTPSWDLGLGSKGVIPNLGQYMSGGKTKKRNNRKNKSSKKKGGFFYEVIKQAAVPFTLLAMSSSYGKGKKSLHKRKKHVRKH